MTIYATDLHLKYNDTIDSATISKLESLLSRGDSLVLGGDIFDSYDIGARDQLFYDFLLRASDVLESVDIIPGNHDKEKDKVVFRLFDYARDNINIHTNYSFRDEGSVRLHFIPHYRGRFPYNVEYGTGSNIAITHADIKYEKHIPDELTRMTKIINGHIHDYSEFCNVVNVGSFRQTRINESQISRYMILDNLEVVEIESPVTNIKYTGTDVSFINSLSKNTVVRWEVGVGFDKSLLSSITNDDVVIMLSANVPKAIVTQDDSATIDGTIDVVGSFEEYVSLFDKNYKTNYSNNVKEYKKIISSLYDSTTYCRHDVKFTSLDAVNFQLFENLSLSFCTYNGLTGVFGLNLDDAVSDNSTSNEAGKSTIRKAIEYLFLGAKSKLVPLKRGEEKGYVSVDMTIGSDKVKIIRSFNSIDHDFKVFINGEEKWKDNTKGDRCSDFLKMYNLESVIDAVIVRKKDSTDTFFTATNKVRNTMLAERFPFIASASYIVQKVKSIEKELKADVSSTTSRIESIQAVRNAVAKSALSEYRHIKASLASMSKESKEFPNSPYYVDGRYNVFSANTDCGWYSMRARIESYGISGADYKYILENADNILAVNSTEQSMTRLQAALDDARNQYLEIEEDKVEYLSGTCPLCKKSNKDDINSGIISTFDNKLKAISEKGKQLRTQYDVLSQEYKKIKDINERYGSIIRSILSFDFTYEPLGTEEQCTLISEHGDEFNRSIDIASNYDKQVSNSKLRIKAILSSVISENDKNRTRDLKKSLELLEFRFSEYSDLLTLLNGKRNLTFETHVVNKLLAHVENNINTHLFNLFTRKVECKVEDSGIVFYDSGNKCDLSSFSGGASTRIKVAQAIVLTQLYHSFVNKVNLVFIDEFLDDGVDSVNIRRVIDVVNNGLKDVDCRFIVSHLPIDDLTDNAVVVRRESESSTICSSFS